MPIWRSQGAEVTDGGVRYRTWCKHESATVRVIDENEQNLRELKLAPAGGGYFSAFDELGAAGDLYRYHFGESAGWPDPASRWQPSGVHGPSMVIDPTRFRWSDEAWMPTLPSELIIYELHVGTFTDAGDFRGVISKLDHLAELGVNAIELMPVADFPGDRNWGYDGVALYAPARAYGHPDDLRSLVQAAHAHGLTVILDVVYNHLGPDGNYLGVFHDRYFNPNHQTPWGAGLNFVEPAVREFFAENATYWAREFHIDGFRLDATHAIVDHSAPHILAEITERIADEGGFAIAEDERNEPALLRSRNDAGLGFAGCWSDDFHHVIRVVLTGEREGYYGNFEGTSGELAETLEHGWLFRGQKRHDGKFRGGTSSGFDPAQFVYCISNHDQTGNRAFGRRLGHLIEPAAYRAASALLCLVPYTPMLFMGQEWSASTPFQFFTDHRDDLGKLVTAGRRQEFRDFAAFRDPELLAKIPDPQSKDTFTRSKLAWDELENAAHAQTLQLYRDCLALRRNHPALRNRARENWSVHELEQGIIALAFLPEHRIDCVVLIDLVGGHQPPSLHRAGLGSNEQTWEPLLSSNDTAYGGNGELSFELPTVLVVQPNTASVA